MPVFNWPGELCGLDRERKTVELGPITLPDGRSELPGRSIPYDTLVLAIGSHSNDFHTPGVSEHCYFMDDVGQAQTLNAAIRSETIRNMDIGEETGVVIIGGGATGVELAAELTRRIQIFSGYLSRTSPPRLRVTLIETGPRLYDNRTWRRCRSPNTTTWSRHSLRIEPISRSAYPFCQGERGDVGRSRIPIDRSLRIRTSP